MHVIISLMALFLSKGNDKCTEKVDQSGICYYSYIRF